MRKLRHALWLVPVAVAAVAGLTADRWLSAAAPVPAADADPRSTTALPVSRVVLFNSGVGYFSREGRSPATPGST